MTNNVRCLSIHYWLIDWLIDSLRIPHPNTRPWWCLWCNFSHNERDTLLVISRWYQIWMIATIIETKTTICLNDAPNYNGLFLPTKMVCVDLYRKWFGLICQEDGLGWFATKMVWVVLPKPCGLGWAEVGLGLGPLVSFLLTSLSLSSSIKYIRRERIEDFVCSVELWDAHVKQQREGT